MNHPATPDLLDELVHGAADDAPTASSLAQCAAVLRRRRRLQAARRVLAVAALLTLAAVPLARLRPAATRVEPPPGQGPTVQRISDSELLAQFPPGTPVAIITVNGSKRVTFPRPEDRARYELTQAHRVAYASSE